MDHRIHHRLADRNRRNAPALATPEVANIRSVQGVLLNKRDRVVNGSDLDNYR
jgi:hypothetical protein